jgi:hypothetical protein
MLLASWSLLGKADASLQGHWQGSLTCTTEPQRASDYEISVRVEVDGDKRQRVSCRMLNWGLAHWPVTPDEVSAPGDFVGTLKSPKLRAGVLRLSHHASSDVVDCVYRFNGATYQASLSRAAARAS